MIKLNINKVREKDTFLRFPFHFLIGDNIKQAGSPASVTGTMPVYFFTGIWRLPLREIICSL